MLPVMFSPRKKVLILGYNGHDIKDSLKDSHIILNEYRQDKTRPMFDPTGKDILWLKQYADSVVISANIHDSDQYKQQFDVFEHLYKLKWGDVKAFGNIPPIDNWNEIFKQWNQEDEPNIHLLVHNAEEHKCPLWHKLCLYRVQIGEMAGDIKFSYSIDELISKL